jgi:transposase
MSSAPSSSDATDAAYRAYTALTADMDTTNNETPAADSASSNTPTDTTNTTPAVANPISAGLGRPPKKKELTPYRRGQISGAHLAGLNVNKISKLLGIPSTTVRYSLAFEENRPDGQTRKRTGRPKCYSEEDERKIIEFVLLNPGSNAAEVQRGSGVSEKMSPATVKRILKANKLWTVGGNGNGTGNAPADEEAPNANSTTREKPKRKSRAKSNANANANATPNSNLDPNLYSNLHSNPHPNTHYQLPNPYTNPRSHSGYNERDTNTMLMLQLQQASRT